jgi:hypothetical protein
MVGTSERCARCGDPVEPGEHLCTQCRDEAPVPVVGTITPGRRHDEQAERERRWPPGMAKPSPVQYHATVMVTVAAVLVGLALFAFLNHRSIGPFSTSGVHIARPARDVIVTTFRVTNRGSREASSTCRITALDRSGTFVASDSVLTRPIPGRGTVSVRDRLSDLPVPVFRVKLECE